VGKLFSADERHAAAAEELARTAAELHVIVGAVRA
jgi:hypothetical protein